jgi:hypothetical protein
LRPRIERYLSLHSWPISSPWTPPQIHEALGELVGAAREGLLALSAGVVHELVEL